MKFKTEGVDPKVPAQALATIVTFVAARYGLEIDKETSGALAVVIGTLVAFFAPAPKTVAK